MSLESIVFSSKHFLDKNEPIKKEVPKEKPPAWLDPEDLALAINPKLKNFPASAENKPEEQIATILRDKFQQTVEHIDTNWSKSSGKGKVDVVDAGDLFSSSQSRIPSDTLAIVRVADLFAQTKQKASILQLAFNPGSSAEPLASVLDSSGCLHIVAVNGKNNKVQFSLPFPREKPRFCQCYTANGEHVVVAGKQGSFITIDCTTRQANVARVPLDRPGDVTRVYCSPDNKTLAMVAGFNLYFFDTANKDLLKALSTSDELKCGAFTDDSAYFVAAGKEGRGHVISCQDNFNSICRFQEPEMQYIHSISISRNLVAMGTDAGVLHMFEFDSLKSPFPKPLFSKMNLTTKVDTVRFNPTGEIVVFGSSGKKDSLKVLHVGAQKVFSNWPTQNTPLSYVRDVAFDRTSKYLAIGNEKGRITLWELSFYA